MTAPMPLSYIKLLLVCSLLLVLVGCDDANGPEALSDRCVACLTEKSSGCKVEWQACDAVASCSSYAFCQMEALCYAREKADRCEEDVGCQLPPDKQPADAGAADSGATSSPRALAADFEDCARTTCRSICGFVAE